MPTNRKKYKEFGALLRAARTEAGLTQRQAAAKLGRPQSMVCRAETGERRVDVSELQEFANAYGKEMAFFLEPNKRQ